MTSDVDVIIAVHRPDRPVLRAVSSALEGNQLDVRFLVVAHNIAPEDLTDYHALRSLGCVEFLSCDDPFPSAAAPRNLALTRCTARWVSTLDSDDRHEPGALTHWVQTGDTTQAAAVVPRHRRASGMIVRTPPQRPFRAVLHPVKDRLAYRVGHLGLTQRSAIKDFSLRYEEQLTVGEDLFFSYPLWFSGRKIVSDNGPAYMVGDAGEHISVGNPAEVELASISRYLRSPHWNKLQPEEKLSIGVKFLRGQVISAASARTPESLNSPDERAAFINCINLILQIVPSAPNYLSQTDSEIILGLLNSKISGEYLVDMCYQRRKSFLHPKNLLSKKIIHTLHNQSPLRFSFASALRR